MDINYEEEDTGLNPPQKFLDPHFLHKVLAKAKPVDSIVAINTIIRDESKKKEVYQQFRNLKCELKFRSHTTEDKNEVIILVNKLSKQSDVTNGE